MATNFTNKYMQVFQNYNEFGEHSADYVRGEDHIAFLIEENEVIYWLYLEQVWRPLNVRTTTTGQLEDGRTKVAVRLEYVEGGQKYTSVPNIPDPERITSMSHFLEDYPDIEEVNVSGTVNLTDLSYAFAGSNIKDFSMLDTSNVTYFNYIFKDINDETRDLFLKINQSINDIIAGDIVLNNLTIESTNEKVISTVKLGESDIKNSLIIKGNINFELIYDTLTSSKFYTFNNIKSDANINLLSNGQDSYVDYNNIICKELTLGWNTINVLNYGYVFETHCDKIIIEKGNNDSYIARDWRKIECYDVKEFILKTRYDNPFSGGIKFNNNDDVKITISDVINIGNFWFTTPIVDDAFYAKYAKYNTPISIFQYKTTFTEVADVNISSEVDSNLIYMSYNINDSGISFDVSNINIEIHNKLNISFSTNKQLKYNKFIIDNSSLDLSEDNLPRLSNKASIYNSSIDYDRVIANEECKISGKYNCNNNSIADLGAFKDITFYNCPAFRLRYELIDRNINFNDCTNLNMDNYIGGNNFNPIKLLDKEDNNIIKSILTASSTWYGNDYISYFIVDYLENKQVIIDYKTYSNWGSISYLCWFLNYYDYTSEDKPIIIKSNTVLCYKTFNKNNSTKKENIYIDCQDAWLDIGFNPNNYNSHINNIYGNVILRISNSNSSNNPVIKNANIQHIDIIKVILYDAANRYEMFNETLDDESTIKLVTMLEDNADGQTKTIYMYRSQANIIGEENIAAAVAKNYEFAIIEN